MGNDVNKIGSLRDKALLADAAYNRREGGEKVGKPGQKFWFEQAATINKKANGIEPDPLNNQSSTFILGYSDFGPVKVMLDS